MKVKVTQKTSKHQRICLLFLKSTFSYLCNSVLNALKAGRKAANKRKPVHFSKSPPAFAFVGRIHRRMKGSDSPGQFVLMYLPATRATVDYFVYRKKADGKSESWPQVVLK